MFQGASSLSLDAKGRLSVPTRHRDALQLQCEGRLTLTRHPDGCLLVYPRPVWEQKRMEIQAFPASARAFQRLLLGNALDVDMDASGRILVSPELRAGARLEKDAMLLGMGTHLELWDRAQYAAHEAEAMLQGIPNSVSGFSY